MSLFWTFREERRLALAAIAEQPSPKTDCQRRAELLLNLADVTQWIVRASGHHRTHVSLSCQGGG